MSWIILSLLICVIENYVVAVTYGPSLVSLTKYNKQVHGPTLFHPETGRLLHLADYPNFSVTVPLAPDSPTATSNQVFISRRVSGPGEFIVQAPSGHGVMAVIQSMDLRLAPTGCNDFIQFGELDGGVETTGTCGKVDNRDGSFAPSELVGPRVFLSPSGKMRVLFYHGYIWGLVRDFNFDLLDPSRNPVLRVEIGFTAYKDCDPLNSTQNDPYRSCSTSPNSRTCIHSDLFCDRVVNCAFEEDFGSDEYISNCYPQLYNLIVVPPPNPVPIQLHSKTNYITSSTTPLTTTSTTTTTKATTTTTSPTTTTTTTTTTPTTTTTTTTTTPFPTTEETTEAPFTKKLQQYFFEISSTSTKAPENISVEAPFEFNYPEIPLVDIEKEVDLETDEVNHNNMTFSEGNDLSVDAEEGKLELLQSDSNTSNLEETLDEEISSSGLIIGVASLVAIIVAFLVCLRIYCCYHTVIWVPNPNNLRRKRKKAESSVYENETGIPEIHSHPKRKGSGKKAKETPPSYDILFPIPNLPPDDDENVDV